MTKKDLPELPVSQLGTQLLNLIKLNVLWLVCSLPIVTMGPALSALNHVVNLYIEEKSDEVMKPFFRAFRRDFRQGLLLGTFLAVLTAITVYDGLFLYANFSGEFHPIWIPFGILDLFLAAQYVYAFPVLSRYRLRFTELLKNSVVLFWQNLWTSLGALLVLLLPVLLAYLFPGAASEVAFLWILCGCSLTVYINNRSILNILDREQRRIESQNMAPTDTES